ncbi:hypothetical protein HZ326_24549 [Fusarium oxysporum f. sp. albedinis]|nr:hypothetical protein HZ326_24549 [Fusarium oxysporum f. sp. albedinis]
MFNIHGLLENPWTPLPFRIQTVGLTVLDLEFKCEEYYSNHQLNWQNRFPEDTDLPPAYYAAQILDPYRKWAWFRQEWVLQAGKEKQKWFDNAQSAVKQLWETEYKGRYAVEMLPPPVRKERYPDPAFDRQREHKRIRIDAPVSAADLYEQYISTDRLHDDEAGCDEAIAYGLSRYDSQRDLARFALDLFAISPMSDELVSVSGLGMESPELRRTMIVRTVRTTTIGSLASTSLVPTTGLLEGQLLQVFSVPSSAAEAWSVYQRLYYVSSYYLVWFVSMFFMSV